MKQTISISLEWQLKSFFLQGYRMIQGLPLEEPFLARLSTNESSPFGVERWWENLPVFTRSDDGGVDNGGEGLGSGSGSGSRGSGRGSSSNETGRKIRKKKDAEGIYLTHSPSYRAHYRISTVKTVAQERRLPKKQQ